MTIPAQRNPNADRVKAANPADVVVRVDVHRSTSGQLVKVEVFGDFSTRVTPMVGDRWHTTPWQLEDLR